MKTVLILLALVFGVAFSIFIDHSSSSSGSFSSSSSSESRESGGGRGNGGRPRPPRPPHRPHRPHRPHPTRRPRPPPVTTVPIPSCEPGWTRVNRISGGWCIKIFHGVLNQPRAEAVCQANGARLSALESHEERQIVQQLATTAMTTQSSWLIGSVRFGIQRNAFNAPFYSTDGNTNSINGIQWSVNEPSTGNAIQGYHNCVLMWLTLPGGKPMLGRGHGQFFSKNCGITWNSAFRAFVCGKPSR